MIPGSKRETERARPSSQPPSQQADLLTIACDLVDKVGIEGAARYCRSLGWAGVLRQVELLRHG